MRSAILIAIGFSLLGCTADQVGGAAKNCLLPGDETGYRNQYCDGYGKPRPIPQVKDWCKHRDNIGVCEDI
jgi:hypothetical protein